MPVLVLAVLLAPGCPYVTGVALAAPEPGQSTSQSAPEVPAVRIGYIYEAKVNVRAKPSTLADVVVKVEKGRVFKVLAKEGQWWKVRFPGGTSGWVAGWVVKTFPLAEAPENVKTKYLKAFKDQAKPAKPEVREATATIAWVGYDVVNVRKAPTTESECVRQLKENMRVRPLLVQGDWVKVALPDNTLGWIYGKLLDYPGDRPLWVCVDAANVRKAPTTESEKLSLLTRGAKVYLVNEKDDWYEVSYGKSGKGWIRKDLLSEDDALGTGAYLKEGSLGAKIVREALKYKGCKYRWGGMSSRGGFDCSGLTAYVLGKFGIKAPHHSGKQFTSLGRPVAKKDLQPGDLVFFNTRAHRVSHVGIYIGNGKFIHAANPRRGVVINSLEEGYYKRTYVGARRVF